MLNYIGAELYRTKNRLYSKMFISICCLLIILCSIAAVYVGSNLGKGPMHMDFVLSTVQSQFQIVYLFTLIIVDIIFTEEYRHHTFKNVVDSGISRRSIYFGKLLSEIIYAIICYVIIVGILLISSYIIFGSDHTATVSSLREFALGTVAAFPLWIVGISIANTLCFAIKSNGMMAFTFAFIIYGTKGILILMGLFFEPAEFIVQFLPSTLLKGIGYGAELTAGFIGECYLVGIVLTVILAVIGMIIFERKEIK